MPSTAHVHPCNTALCCTYAAGWTGFLDLFLGHYGIEVEEENILLFVGIIPIAIDVWFKYWIFIGEQNGGSSGTRIVSRRGGGCGSVHDSS
jgi:hypothetical protein